MPTLGEARTATGKTVKGSFLYLREVAKEVDVHPSTILRWVNAKKVAVTGYKDRRGHWVFREADVEKFEKYKNDIRPVTVP